MDFTLILEVGSTTPVCGLDGIDVGVRGREIKDS